jgi:acyl dehydratase
LRKLDLLDSTIIALKAVEWSFNAPIKPGDEVHVRATVIEARRSSKAPDRGVLSLAIEVRNQHDVTVQAGKVTGIMSTRPATPA